MDVCSWFSNGTVVAILALLHFYQTMQLRQQQLEERGSKPFKSKRNLAYDFAFFSALFCA